jgi:hypothetical protein
VTGRRMLDAALGHAQDPPAVLIPRGDGGRGARPNPRAILTSTPDDERPDMAAVEARIRAKAAETGARFRANHPEIAARTRRERKKDR